MYEKQKVNNKRKKLTSLTSEKTWASFNLQVVLHFVCFFIANPGAFLCVGGLWTKEVSSSWFWN